MSWRYLLVLLKFCDLDKQHLCYISMTTRTQDTSAGRSVILDEVQLIGRAKAESKVKPSVLFIAFFVVAQSKIVLSQRSHP